MRTLHQHDQAKREVLALYLEVVGCVYWMALPCGASGTKECKWGDLSVVVVVKMKTLDGHQPRLAILS